MRQSAELRESMSRINLERIARIIVLVVGDMVLITLAFIVAIWLPFSAEGSRYAFPFHINGVNAYS